MLLCNVLCFTYLCSLCILCRVMFNSCCFLVMCNGFMFLVMCFMLCVVCNVLCVLCFMLCVVCNVKRAICNSLLVISIKACSMNLQFYPNRGKVRSHLMWQCFGKVSYVSSRDVYSDVLVTCLGCSCDVFRTFSWGILVLMNL